MPCLQGHACTPLHTLEGSKGLGTSGRRGRGAAGRAQDRGRQLPQGSSHIRCRRGVAGVKGGVEDRWGRRRRGEDVSPQASAHANRKFRVGGHGTQEKSGKAGRMFCGAAAVGGQDGESTCTTRRQVRSQGCTDSCTQVSERTSASGWKGQGTSRRGRAQETCGVVVDGVEEMVPAVDLPVPKRHRHAHRCSHVRAPSAPLPL